MAIREKTNADPALPIVIRHILQRNFPREMDLFPKPCAGYRLPNGAFQLRMLEGPHPNQAIDLSAAARLFQKGNHLPYTL
jgi:hypothetical protein